MRTLTFLLLAFLMVLGCYNESKENDVVDVPSKEVELSDVQPIETSMNEEQEETLAWMDFRMIKDSLYRRDGRIVELTGENFLSLSREMELQYSCDKYSVNYFSDSRYGTYLLGSYCQTSRYKYMIITLLDQNYNVLDNLRFLRSCVSNCSWQIFKRPWYYSDEGKTESFTVHEFDTLMQKDMELIHLDLVDVVSAKQYFITHVGFQVTDLD